MKMENKIQKREEKKRTKYEEKLKIKYFRTPEVEWEECDSKRKFL